MTKTEAIQQAIENLDVAKVTQFVMRRGDKYDVFPADRPTPQGWKTAEMISVGNVQNYRQPQTYERIDAKVEAGVNALTSAVDRAEAKTGHHLGPVEIDQEKERVFGACGGKCGEAPCIAYNEEKRRKAAHRARRDDLTITEAPTPQLVDVTPEALKTPEGVKRAEQAQKEWDDATHEIANTLKWIIDEIFDRHIDKVARAEYYSQLQTLIGIRDVKQEAFMRAVTGR